MTRAVTRTRRPRKAPSARTVRRLLMRSRACRRGSRALISVSLSLSTIPETPPRFDAPGRPDPYSYGVWYRQDGDRETLVTINMTTSSRDPRDEPGPVQPLLVTHDAARDSWSWWEGVERSRCGFDSFYGDPSPLDPAIVDAYVALWRWRQKWLLGATGETGVAAIDALHSASAYAASMGGELDGNKVVLTYDVKVYRRQMGLWFSQRLSSAMRRCLALGVDVAIGRS